MRLEQLETPCLVVDLDRLERNIRSWQDAVAAGGPRFRPHIKTHKTIEIARRQLAAGAAGITVAKVSEAELYVANGHDDVVVAYPVASERACHRLARLAAGARVAVNVENEHAAAALSRAAAGRGAEIGVYLDIDTGLGRCGVPAADPAAVDRLAERLRQLPGLTLRGVTTYRGVSYAGATGTVADRAREEAETAVAEARRLGVDEVAVGSTPTGRGAAEVGGVTEVRAGTYVFNDLMQLGQGSAQPDDVALTILTTVVSAQRAGRVTVDGGSKTFSGDVVLDRDGGRMVARSADGSVTIDGLTEEHGVGRSSRPVEVGERIAFIPAHVCTTVNLSDRLYAARDGRVEAVWRVAARGLRT
jgi:D-serine deaminase-like pyridoxal phosphate-dependent protein